MHRHFLTYLYYIFDCKFNYNPIFVHTMENDNAIIKDGEETSRSTCGWQPCSSRKLSKLGVSDCVYVYAYICMCINTDAFKIHIA